MQKETQNQIPEAPEQLTLEAAKQKIDAVIHELTRQYEQTKEAKPRHAARVVAAHRIRQIFVNVSTKNLRAMEAYVVSKADQFDAAQRIDIEKESFGAKMAENFVGPTFDTIEKSVGAAKRPAVRLMQSGAEIVSGAAKAATSVVESAAHFTAGSMKAVVVGIMKGFGLSA